MDVIPVNGMDGYVSSSGNTGCMSVFNGATLAERAVSIGDVPPFSQNDWITFPNAPGSAGTTAIDLVTLFSYGAPFVPTCNGTEGIGQNCVPQNGSLVQLMRTSTGTEMGIVARYACPECNINTVLVARACAAGVTPMQLASQYFSGTLVGDFQTYLDLGDCPEPASIFLSMSAVGLLVAMRRPANQAP